MRYSFFDKCAESFISSRCDLDPENTRMLMEFLPGANKRGTAVIVVTRDEDVPLYGNARFSMNN